MRSDRTNGGHWFLSGPLVVQYRYKHTLEKSWWCSTAVEKATKPISSMHQTHCWTHRIKSFHLTHPISNRPNTLPLKKNRWSHSVTLKVFQNNDSLRARKCGLTIRDALLEKNGIMWEKFPSGKPLVQYTVEKSQWCNVAQLEHLGRSIHPFDATHILPSQPVQGPTSQIPPKLILFQDLWFATKFHKEISLNLDAIT